ncbi:MAG: hypothetical protein AAGC60_10735 [Acidobacteriota bacterium]
MRYLVRRGADAVETLARVESYWTRSMAAAYLDLLDEVAADDPPTAAAMAEAAPRLVRRAALGRGVDGWRSAAELASYRALSWAHVASCRRAAGDLRGADVAIGRACELALRPGVADWTRGEIERRRAIIVANALGPEAGLEAAQRAVDACRAADYSPGLADALVAVGTCLEDLGRYGDAVAAYSEALPFIDATTSRGTRTRLAAVAYLASAAGKGACSSGQLRAAVHTLRETLRATRSRMLRGYLEWGLGLLEMRAGLFRSAARRLRRAAVALAVGGDPILLGTLAHDLAQLVEVAGSDSSSKGVSANADKALLAIAPAFEGRDEGLVATYQKAASVIRSVARSSRTTRHPGRGRGPVS